MVMPWYGDLRGGIAISVSNFVPSDFDEGQWHDQVGRVVDDDVRRHHADNLPDQCGTDQCHPVINSEFFL